MIAEEEGKSGGESAEDSFQSIKYSLSYELSMWGIFSGSPALNKNKQR